MNLRERALIYVGVAIILVSLGMLIVGFGLPGLLFGREEPATPEDETMWLTVPKMERAKNVPVYTAAADDEGALGAGSLHVKGTGFPWQKGSNVYIAGHRLGYAGTYSFLVFYDLNKLRDGDKVVLKDAAGRRYVYKVFDRFVVGPDDDFVTEPVEGKNIVSLQTCTLPDYANRLVVRAELTRIREPETA